METFELKRIGTINAADGRCTIRVNRPYRPALAELTGFGFVNVLFWCHTLDNPEHRSLTRCPKPYRHAPDAVGVFATRSPARPNPIALTPCAVIDVDETIGVLTVPFIDADDGSPLLDIKPYHPAIDRVRRARVPPWCAHWPEWYEDAATFDWAAEFVHAR
ncbi:MAG: TrmO family methyltransferase [Spirochaetales bacterium]|nr:TrmO family methyltransferase [Spirochaetales bacterium]